MKVIGTDADDKRLPNAQIAYRIDEKSSGANMFYIDSRTGDIRVKQNNLDREVSHYKVPIIKKKYIYTLIQHVFNNKLFI